MYVSGVIASCFFLLAAGEAGAEAEGGGGGRVHRTSRTAWRYCGTPAQSPLQPPVTAAFFGVLVVQRNNAASNLKPGGLSTRLCRKTECTFLNMDISLLHAVVRASTHTT